MIARTAARRRIAWGLTILVLFAGFLSVDAVYESGLRRPAFLEGWLLISCVAFLALFNARKKLPMLPLGRAALWTRIHIWLGFFTLALFFVHGGFGPPQGALDLALWLAFLLVALSGVTGLYLSRTVPARLGEAQERILLERIPQFRARLAREAGEIAERSIADEASLTIASFYAATLHDFMREPRHLLAHLRGSRQPLIAICDAMERIERYVDDAGRARLAEIRERVIAKYDLDFQHAHLMMLRLWLFVHVPATYALLLLALVHLLVVYAFSSGAP